MLISCSRQTIFWTKSMLFHRPCCVNEGVLYFVSSDKGGLRFMANVTKQGSSLEANFLSFLRPRPFA